MKILIATLIFLNVTTAFAISLSEKKTTLIIKLKKEKDPLKRSKIINKVAELENKIYEESLKAKPSK